MDKISDINNKSHSPIQACLTERKDGLLFVSLIFLFTFLAYIPAMRGGFIWDDDAHAISGIVTSTGTLDALRRIWLTTESQQYYPMVYTTFAIERLLWGFDPMGYHIVNVFLHTANSIFVYLVFSYLGFRRAWLIGFIFALHPVHVESVAWISERKNVLSGLFYLLSFMCYLKFEDRYGIKWYAASLLSFVLAILSKTVVSTLPLVIVLACWMRGKRLGLKEVLPLVPYFVLGLIMGIVTIWWETNLVGTKSESWDLDFFDRVVLAGRVIWFYIGKLLLPLNLSFIYPRWQIDASSPLQWIYTAGAAGVCVLLWLVQNRIGRKPFFCFAYFVITLFPALGFFNVYPFKFSFVADHFQYLASIGIIAILTAFFFQIIERLDAIRKKSAVFKILLAGVFLSFLWILTFKQGFIYKDKITLWEDTLKKNPGAWLAHINLCYELLLKGKTDEAIYHSKKALELNNSEARLHYYMGFTYFKKSNILTSQGMNDEALLYNEKAISHYKEAIHLKPAVYEPIYNDLGVSLLKKGDIEGAVTQFRMALILKPDFKEAKNNLNFAINILIQSSPK
ncbi:MAG: tetratricopeptide repeat protein [Nitrospinae bacterium]|nr:tetratricopeptide repeat protein [Nitrospinota bacterium]